MNTYYVDISVDEGIGTKSGLNPSNYMGWNQFVHQGIKPNYGGMWIVNNPGSLYLLRGSRDITTFTYNPTISDDWFGFWGVKDTQFCSWDKNVYGPWRIYGEFIRISTPSPFSGSYIFWDIPVMEGGILEALANFYVIDENYSTDISFSGMSFKSGTWLSFGHNTVSSVNFQGCRLDAVNNINLNSNIPGAIRLYDSVVKTPLLSSSSGNMALGCSFSAASLPPGLSPTNCQTGWSATITPSWNAAQVAWANATVNAGISSPPEPGIPPYAGYNSGLWGGDRVGIGAADFFASAIGINVTPSVYSFGTTFVGDTIDQVFTVTNTGTTSDLSVTDISGAVMSFSKISDNVTGIPIAPGASATFTIRFTAYSAGIATTTLSISSNATSFAVIDLPLSANAAVPVMGVDPSWTPYDFGAAIPGDTLTVQLTVSNTGNVPLIVGSLSTLTSPFSITSDQISGATISVGDSKTATLNFAPVSGGTFSQTLSIPSNTPSTPYELPLLGHGAVAGNHYVLLDTNYTGIGHLGTTGDPWTYDDVTNYLGNGYAVAGDVINFRGQIDTGNGFYFYTGIGTGVVTLQAWDAIQYGPWRISTTDEVDIGDYHGDISVVIKNAIINSLGGIYLSTEMNSPISLYTCSFYADNIEIYDSTPEGNSIYPLVIDGCCFNGGESTLYLYTDNDGSVNFQITDTQINMGSVYGESTENCVLSVTNSTYAQDSFDSLSGSFSEINVTGVQFSMWVSVPSWDAAKESFAYSLISDSLTTPPRLGTPPYTGYNTGLWGESRTGIGAFYFDSALPPIPPAPPYINDFGDGSGERETSVVVSLDGKVIGGEIHDFISIHHSR